VKKEEKREKKGPGPQNISSRPAPVDKSTPIGNPMLEVEPTGHTGRTANGSSKMGRGISFHCHRGDTSLYVDLFGLHTLTAGECRARKMAISLLHETSKKCACYTTIMHRPIRLRTYTITW